FIRRKSHAIRAVQLIGYQPDFAGGRNTIHPLERQFLGRIVAALLKSVGWVRKVDRAVAVLHQVVRRIDFFVIEAVGQRHKLGFGVRQRGVHTGDTAVAVLGQQKRAVIADNQSVGAHFAAALFLPGIAGRLQILGNVFAFFPFVDDIVGNVR